MNETASRALFEEDVGKITDRLLASRNWGLYAKAFPILDVGFRGENRTELRVRLVAKDWNEAPPSAELFDAGGNFLTSTQQLQGVGIFHPGIHPVTGRFFVCMAGTQEYHTHSSHVGDSWNNYRTKDAYTLGGIMTQIWSAWKKLKS